MAEQLEGSFTFTLLGADDVFYLVKGDSPMCLYYYPKAWVYLYASTEEILLQVLRRIRLPLGKPVRILTPQGEILRISADGTIMRG
jgi:glucosamine--fructose-6-phosphate aminotransferase (isomerizing)